MCKEWNTYFSIVKIYLCAPLLIALLMTMACASPTAALKGDWRIITTQPDSARTVVLLLSINKKIFHKPQFTIGTINDCSYEGYINTTDKGTEFIFYRGHRGYGNYICKNQYEGYLYGMFGEGRFLNVTQHGDTVILFNNDVEYRLSKTLTIVSY